MPEGDTIHTLARYLGAALGGGVVTRVRVRGQVWPDLAGLRIQGVSSKGKHLYLELNNGLCLRSHLGLYGSWHRYRPHEPWQKPERQAVLVLEMEGWAYVCFNAKEVELTRSTGFESRDQRGRLGPDLTQDTPDADLIRRRALALSSPDTPLVDLLLDQRVACGIGNVYKSEVLFLTRRPPVLTVQQLSLQDFVDLYGNAARLLRRNLGGGPRTTRAIPDGRGPLWVYGRAGLPCLVCGTPVRRERLGREPRSTYWCPTCQGPVPAPERAA
jgi:endonuclease-8